MKIGETISRVRIPYGSPQKTASNGGFFVATRWDEKPEAGPPLIKD